MRKMKKEYAEPKVQVVKMDTEDIIRTSTKLGTQDEASWTDDTVSADQFGL